MVPSGLSPALFRYISTQNKCLLSTVQPASSLNIRLSASPFELIVDAHCYSSSSFCLCIASNTGSLLATRLDLGRCLPEVVFSIDCIVAWLVTALLHPRHRSRPSQSLFSIPYPDLPFRYIFSVRSLLRRLEVASNLEGKGFGSLEAALAPNPGYTIESTICPSNFQRGSTRGALPETRWKAQIHLHRRRSACSNGRGPYNRHQMEIRH